MYKEVGGHTYSLSIPSDVQQISEVDDDSCMFTFIKSGLLYRFNLIGVSATDAKDMIAKGRSSELYGKKWELAGKNKVDGISVDPSRKFIPKSGIEVKDNSTEHCTGNEPELTPDQLIREYNETGWRVIPSRIEAAKIAATLPNKNMAELMDNTEKIIKWLGDNP